MRTPGGADDLDDGVVPSRWITVVIYPDELGWLREALQLRAAGDGEDEPGTALTRHLTSNGRPVGRSGVASRPGR